MILYKHLQSEDYLNNWLSGSFVFTKLDYFHKIEDEKRGDNREGALVAPIQDGDKLIFEKFNNFDLAPFIERDSGFTSQMPEDYRKFILISSFSTETNEELQNKFGKYVLRFNFTEELQAIDIFPSADILLSGNPLKELQEKGQQSAIFHGPVIYDHNSWFEATGISRDWDLSAQSYNKLTGCQKLSLAFRKRPEFQKEKEYRFAMRVLFDVKNAGKNGEDIYNALAGDKDDENHYDCTMVFSDGTNKIMGLKEFFHGNYKKSGHPLQNFRCSKLTNAENFALRYP